jgi:hypothetical protein
MAILEIGMHDAGKTTYVWMGLPGSPSGVPEALARKAAFGTDWPLTQPYSIYERDFAFLRRIAADNADLLAGTISVAEAMCEGGLCRFVADGRPLFHDDNHPAYSSSSFFATHIERELQAAASRPPTGRSN